METIEKIYYVVTVWFVIFMCLTMITLHNSSIHSATNDELEIQYFEKSINKSYEEKVNIINSHCIEKFGSEEYKGKLWMYDFLEDESNDIRSCKLNLMK